MFSRSARFFLSSSKLLLRQSPLKVSAVLSGSLASYSVLSRPSLMEAATPTITPPQLTLTSTHIPKFTTINDLSSDKITLYQFSICPFCHRVSALLDFLKIPHDKVEVNPATRSEIKKISKEFKKVPILSINNNREFLNESTYIISYLIENILLKNPSAFSSIDLATFLPADYDKWIDWSEKKLALLLYPNITRSYKDARELSSYALKIDQWSSFEKFLVKEIGSIGMFFANSKVKKKYNIIDERKDLLNVVDEWTSSLKGKYLYGENISLPDVVVFGVFHAISDTATFREVMNEKKELKTWYDNVDASIYKN